MNPKDIAYLVLAGFTILGNVATICYFLYSAKFKITALDEKITKIHEILYPEKGQLQFRTVDDCKTCQKICRDDLCDFVRDGFEKQAKTMLRINERLDRQSEAINSIRIWMPKERENGSA